MERFVNLFSAKGDLVFDPFAGSATTLLAARAMGRKCVAYERDSSIFDAACSRIEGALL